MQTELTLKNLNLPVPDGFHVMDDAELSDLKLLADGDGVGLSDPERHMIVTAGTKQINGFSAALLNARDLAKNMEKQIRKPMASLGYRCEGFRQQTVGGRTAEGFRYSYTAQGVGMTGESYVVKDGKSLYYLHAYMRTELLEASLPVWEEVLATAAFR